MGTEGEAMGPLGPEQSSSIGWARFGLAFALGLLACSVVSWLLFSRSADDGGPSTMEMRVVSIRELYPDALAAAREWRNDAILEEANASFQPAEMPGEMTADFGFRSPGEPGVYLLVWITQSGDSILLQLDEGSNPSDKPVGEPIDPLQFPFDSSRVLEIALQAGGSEFLEEHSSIDWPQSLTLEYEDLFYSRGRVLWVVRFLERGSLAHMEVSIDAHTGEVVEQ